MVVMYPDIGCFMGMFMANFYHYVTFYISYNDQQMHN